MICSKCSNNLILSNSKGVEIDYCPNCKGVWLDRGELDKIVERSNAHNPSEFFENRHQNHHDNHYDQHNEHGYGNHPSNRKKGFLSDLFDF